MTRSLVVAVFLLAAACGGGDGGEEGVAARVRSTSTSTTATPAAVSPAAGDAASTGTGSDYGLPSGTELTAPPTPTTARGTAAAAPSTTSPQTTTTRVTSQTTSPPPTTTASSQPPSQPQPQPQPQPTTTTAPQGPTVTIQNFAFSPAVLDVAAGTTVTATNLDASAHTWTGDDGSWDSGPLSKDGTAAHTFSQPGTFTYRCDIHPSMKGTVRVS